jgi:hypothetical protein
MLSNHRKIGRRYHPAIEGADRRRDLQGVEQHPQAAGRSTADDCKNDSACAELGHGCLGARGQTLVVGHQRSVDIRDKGGDFRRWKSQR